MILPISVSLTIPYWILIQIHSPSPPPGSEKYFFGLPLLEDYHCNSLNSSFLIEKKNASYLNVRQNVHILIETSNFQTVFLCLLRGHQRKEVGTDTGFENPSLLLLYNLADFYLVYILSFRVRYCLKKDFDCFYLKELKKKKPLNYSSS